MPAPGAGRRGQVAGPARTRTLAAPAKIHKPDHGIDQHIVGGELQGVHPGAAPDSRAATPRAARRSRAYRWRNPVSWVSTSNCSPVSASRTVDQPHVGQVHLQRINHPHRHHIVALRQLAQGLLPARLADEVGDHKHRAALAHRSAPPLSASRPGGSHPTSSPAAKPAACARSIWCSNCSTWLRPPRAGNTLTASFCPAPNNKAPTRLPCRLIRRDNTPTKPCSTSLLRCSPEPKLSEGLRSSKNQAVISRSSVNTLTCGCCRRAVTFQSMCRTSSWCWYSRRSARSRPVPRISVRWSPCSQPSSRRITVHSSRCNNASARSDPALAGGSGEAVAIAAGKAA